MEHDDESSWDAVREHAFALQNDPRVPLNILRVDQMDAAELDDAIVSLLKEPFARAAALFGPGLTEQYKPELDAAIKLLLHRFSVFANEPSPGMRFQNLRYRNESLFVLPSHASLLGMKGDMPTRGQRIVHGLLSIGAAWAWARVHRYCVLAGWGALPPDDRRATAWRWLCRAETAWQVCSFANLVVFLRHGRFRSVPDRLLGMRMVYPNAKPIQRGITFDYLNRQMVWDRLTAFLLFIMPLVRWGSWWSKTAMLLRLRRTAGSHTDGIQADSPADHCVVCGLLPQMACTTNCGHVHCYYCLAQACGTDQHGRSSRRVSQPTCAECGSDIAFSSRTATIVKRHK